MTIKDLAGKSDSRQQISGSDSTDYYAPESLEEAINILADSGDQLEILAGGTDLLVDYFEGLFRVKGWLDLKNIPHLQGITLTDDKIIIGPLTTHAQLEKSEDIKNSLPVLGEAAADIGSPQIRSRGTIGGNIVTASPAGDLLPPLLAYNASFKLQSKKGEEVIPAADFFRGPKKTVIESDQILTEIIIPRPGKNTCGQWIKIGKRKEMVISTITLALVVNLTVEREIKDLRVCLGSVAPTPLEITEVRDRCVGKKLDQIDFELAGDIVAEGVSPIDDIRGTREYRQDVARDLMIRALEGVSSK